MKQFAPLADSLALFFAHVLILAALCLFPGTPLAFCCKPHSRYSLNAFSFAELSSIKFNEPKTRILIRSH